MKTVALTSSSIEKGYKLYSRYVRYVLSGAAFHNIPVLPVILPFTDDPDVIRGYAHAFDGYLFTGGDDASMPTTAIGEAQLENGSIGLLSLLVACGLAASNGEARRLVQQGGIALDDVKAEAVDARVTAEALQKGVKIKKGKKIFHKAVLK